MIKSKILFPFFCKVICFISLFFIFACSQQINRPHITSVNTEQKTNSLYEEIGGKAKIAEIAQLFLDEVSYHPDVLPYFQNTNITRFEEKFIEHLCLISGGPCQYTGDTMQQVHAGMNVTEADFNALVDLLVNAMSRASIAHTTQNKLLARLVPMRKDIIYR
jgi:hemoglobin